MTSHTWKVIYSPPRRCVHLIGEDLPSPGLITEGTIIRCDCGSAFRRVDVGGWEGPTWIRTSEGKVRRILKRAAKEKGQV